MLRTNVSGMRKAQSGNLIGGRVGRVEARPLVQPEVERLLLPDVERGRVDDRRLEHLAAREHAPRDGDRALAAVALVHATCSSPTSSSPTVGWSITFAQVECVRVEVGEYS